MVECLEYVNGVVSVVVVVIVAGGDGGDEIELSSDGIMIGKCSLFDNIFAGVVVLVVVVVVISCSSQIGDRRCID